MSLFNAIYSLGGTQPIQENSKITIEFDSQATWALTARWAKWFVTLPIRLAHGAYNHISMARNNDINEVFARQVYSGNSINCMQFLIGKSGHILSSPRAISAMTSYYRDDPQGPFEAEKEDPYIPLLKDLFPDESIDQEDFLLTCPHDHVASYRNPFLQYVGPKALPTLRPQITTVAEEVLESIKGENVISARILAETYTVAILARLFLNHPGTLADFQIIGRAASFILEYQFLKKWGTPNISQNRQYLEGLQTLRSAIEHSSGKFIKSLEASDLSPIRIKGELVLLYVAGSETTSSVMQYILWRLGQDLDLQDRIRKDPVSHLDTFINACLKQYTPVTAFTRFARQDIVIKVQNQEGKIWQYPIAKGEAIIAAPHLAESSTFGGGVHSCPGQWLARAEIRSMLVALLKRYSIDSSPRKKELSTKPGVGMLSVEPVELTLRKIS